MTFLGTSRHWARTATALLSLSLMASAGCKAKVGSKKKSEDGGASDGATAKDGGGDSGAAKAMLLQAPAAKEIASLMLDEPVGDVVHIADLALSLHTTSGVSILDLSDPSAPKVASKLPTTGRAVGVAYDVELRILFIITVSGDLRAYRVADVTAPVQAAQSSITEPNASGDTIQGLTRIGGHLFLLGKSNMVPVSVLYGASGSVGFLAQTAVKLDADAQLLSSGGDSLFIGFKGGKVQIWSGGDAPSMLDQGSLGADIVGWVIRGSRLFVALKGRGLRVIDMTVKGQVKVLFDAPDLNDPAALKRFGNLVLVSLSRGLLVALDLSSLEAPRALVSHTGSIPDWIAPVGGNLLLGSGKQLTVFGVPPFVSATVPQLLRSAFPRYGRIPLQLSKPLDPGTVTAANIKLRCGGTVIEGSVAISPDGLHVTFLPKGDLPSGADCTLSLDGVKDALGLNLSVPQAAPALSFSTMTQAPAAVDNKKSGYAHTADGAFTDWTKGKTKDFEYFDVNAARGMYSYFYADHDGTRLFMLNDWFYNGDSIDPDCFNQFGVWTGGGQERWDIRAYGDQHIEVRLNGTLLAAEDKRVSGGYGLGPSPNLDTPHTIYEISIETAPGAWGVQLHDPGPTFGCERLETDPTTYNAMTTATGSSIDPRTAPTMPAKPTPDSRKGSVGNAPTLSWSTTDMPSNFTTYLFELLNGDGTVLYRTWVYGTTFTLPLGLVQDGMTYSWRVTAYNLAGSSQSDSGTFTVGQAPSVSAPKLKSVQPTSVTQSRSQSVTITGTGFVEGAKAYFNGVALNTTFVSSTELMAMIDSADLATVGTFSITVRNVPGDDTTQSNGLKLSVQAPASTCGHPECIPGDTLPSDCSACAAEVCASHANCCSSSWDTGCVNAAAASQTCGCHAPALTGLSPTPIGASADTVVTATLSDAPAGVTYALVLTATTSAADASPTTGTFTCVSSEANSCVATVNLPAGTYNALIRVGASPTFDTNTVNDALTVNTGCAHSECASGASLPGTCSTCAHDVCASTPACCSSAWGLDCILVADGLKTCPCTGRPTVTTGALSVTSQTAGASTPVSVTIGNALAGVTYTLVLMPHGTQTENTFPCTLNQAGTACDATISGLSTPGSYDVLVRVTSGSATFNTNPAVLDAFTVNAGSVCPHNACLPGDRMASGCLPCVTTICADSNTAHCCTTAWDQTCVAAAPTLGMCGCRPPSLQSGALSPASQAPAASTPVTVTIMDAMSTVTYQLVLQPVGGGNDSVFTCTYNQNPGNTCTATVSGMAAGTYNAVLRVSGGSGPSTYDSPKIDSAFLVMVAG
jgi:hypothetical protein